MFRVHTTGLAGYWIINLCVLLCNLNIIISQSCDSNNGTKEPLPKWPCQWNDGVIPFVFDFYSLTGLKRLISLVKKAHSYLEQRSCLVFQEHDPVELAKRENFTYLFYSYSGVLETCCWPFFSKPVGRRMVVITPLCTLPAEAAHATLHALGLYHRKDEPFSEQRTKQVLFVAECEAMTEKLALFDNSI